MVRGAARFCLQDYILEGRAVEPEPKKEIWMAGAEAKKILDGGVGAWN